MIWGGRWRRVRRVMVSYRAHHGRWPNLLWPRRYSEKVQWRKLFDRDPLHTVLCDKLATRDFILARWPEAPLPPLLWRGEAAGVEGAGECEGDGFRCAAPILRNQQVQTIPFDELVPPYVLKSSHACGHVIFVDGAVDRGAVAAAAQAWLGQCYGTAADEPGYVAVPRRLLAERRLFGDGGGAPVERRVFMFDGKPAVVNTVFREEGRVRNGAFHLPDWTRLGWYLSRDLAARAFPRPARLEEILAAAARIAAGMAHARVDFYDGGSAFWVGEVTVYPWSGHAVFTPDEADFTLGRLWRLRRRPRVAASGAVQPTRS